MRMIAMIYKDRLDWGPSIRLCRLFSPEFCFFCCHWSRFWLKAWGINPTFHTRRWPW
jgi:hypothetical protein